jgi:hypothetical protein
MRKGITLQVSVKIEGDRPPAEDFEAVATASMRRVIAAGAKQDHAGLSFAVTAIAVDDGTAADEGLQHA